MKKLFFTFFSLLLISGLTAQEDPGKALKKATRALGAYNLDPAANEAKLAAAVDYIEMAIADENMQSNIKAWQARGEVYNALAQKDVNNMILNPEYVPQNPDAALKASESFYKALSLAQKKYEKKDALEGLQEAGKNLNIIGNFQIGEQNYADAFKTFDTVLKIHETLKANGEDSPIADDDLENQKFITAYCANASGNTDRAKVLFKEMYEAGSNEPGVYAQYFNILNAEGDENAVKVLNEARQKFPDNAEILFAEINYYIAQNKFDILEDKLKLAIEKEPNNPSVRTALGNVYMNLYETELNENGETEKAKKYFDSAIDYFNQALEMNPKSFDALYSIGSMYFNKAVELYKKMANLGMSKEDQKLYEQYKEEADGLMKTSLPYFTKAESINPNDLNTLIALSEVFARTNDLEKSKLFKERMQVVKDGGQHETSYFKN